MRTLGRIFVGAAVALYPAAIYAGLTRFDVRTVAAGWLGVFLASRVPSWLRAFGASRDAARRASRDVTGSPAVAFASMRRALTGPVVPVVAALALAMTLRSQTAVLFVPVIWNVSLLLAFGLSLRAGRVPLVERFARLMDPSFEEVAVPYCRRVTVVWTGFLAFNAGVTAALAAWAPLEWWALHTGLLAYGAMGLLFAGEFIVRKATFRQYAGAWHDPLFRRWFPPRAEPS